MPGTKITPYVGPAPKRDSFDQVANYPSDPREQAALCRFAVNSLKELVPLFEEVFPRQEVSK